MRKRLSWIAGAVAAFVLVGALVVGAQVMRFDDGTPGYKVALANAAGVFATIFDYAGSNPVATVAVDPATGDALTPSEDVVEDVAEAGGESGPLAMSVRRDTAASSSGLTGDFSTLNTDGLGRLWTRNGNPCADHARVSFATINTSGSGNIEVVALASGQTIYVCGYDVIVDAAVDFQWIYGTGSDRCNTGETDISGPMGFAANGGAVRANAGAVQFKTAAANALCFESSGAVQVSGYVTYVQTNAP